jgi:hypothetical protein
MNDPEEAAYCPVAVHVDPSKCEMVLSTSLTVQRSEGPLPQIAYAPPL